jgi:hypothetical protein
MARWGPNWPEDGVRSVRANLRDLHDLCNAGRVQSSEPSGGLDAVKRRHRLSAGLRRRQGYPAIRWRARLARRRGGVGGPVHESHCPYFARSSRPQKRSECELLSRNPNAIPSQINVLTLSTQSAQYQGSERTRPPESENHPRCASAVSRPARGGAGNLRLSAPVTGREKGWIRGDWSSGGNQEAEILWQRRERRTGC